VSPNSSGVGVTLLQRLSLVSARSMEPSADPQLTAQKIAACLEPRDVGAMIAADPSPHGRMSKSLLLVDALRLSRECLTHLLVSHLSEYDLLTLAHARLAGEGDPRPDVVLLNARSAHIYDAALASEVSTLLALTHRAPILILSEHIDGHEGLLAGESGIAGLFPMACSAALLIAAIRLVAAGGQFYAPPALIARGEATSRSGPPHRNR